MKAKSHLKKDEVIEAKKLYKVILARLEVREYQKKLLLKILHYLLK